MRLSGRFEQRESTADARDLRALLACILGAALVVAALVGLVLVRISDVQAGYDLYSLQKQKVELTQRKSALELELAALKRPDRLARIGRELGLAPPRADQVLRSPADPAPSEGRTP